MTEKSTSPDLIELGSRFLEAANRRDLDAMVSFFAPDAVWEGMALRTTLEGVAAIRGFWQDWLVSYEEFWLEPEEMLDLGNGVAFGVVILLGLLPVFMVWRGRYVQHRTGLFRTPGGRWGLILALIISLSVVGLEIANKTGYLKFEVLK